MLTELFIAWRVNHAANSLRRLERDDTTLWALEGISDWIKRLALKQEMKKLETESENIAYEYERPVSKPDTSKLKRDKDKK
jgi:hypothetical protein